MTGLDIKVIEKILSDQESMEIAREFIRKYNENRIVKGGVTS